MYSEAQALVQNCRCLALFPEIADDYSVEEIKSVINLTYPFHEDLFCSSVRKRRFDREYLLRAADYIESLARSANINFVNLAEIGVLGSMVSYGPTEIASYLHPACKKLLLSMQEHTRVDEKIWKVDRASWPERAWFENGLKPKKVKRQERKGKKS